MFVFFRIPKAVLTDVDGSRININDLVTGRGKMMIKYENATKTEGGGGGRTSKLAPLCEPLSPSRAITVMFCPIIFCRVRNMDWAAHKIIL